ncbi:hypothetical protein [Capnocytophaga sp.]|uniref:hypothetical protein n=1 Tax=Capnocytophaga sp. TaxID=44737 RepID=UPI0026DA82D0|nr:hypothetical protein [Capnocytophaga sp.]MDO5106029.1 hypothetical protein [Capnocytophaga sp.]
MNGYLRPKKQTAPTYNEFGDEISTSSAYDEAFIPCKYYSASRDDLVEVGNGVFQQASYVITTLDMEVTGKHFALYDSRKNLVCEKDCKSLERLETIGRTKILL